MHSRPVREGGLVGAGKDGPGGFLPLLRTNCLLLVVLVRLPVVLPVVLLVYLFNERRQLDAVSIIGAGRGDAVLGCKTFLHMQRGVRAAATHVLCATVDAVRIGAPLGAACGGVARMHITKVAAPTCLCHDNTPRAQQLAHGLAGA